MANTKSEFDFFPYIIVRTPLFSIKTLLETKNNPVAREPYFEEAIRIASPDLAKITLDSQHNGKGTEQSLFKYFNRMCFRCTPFGIFAGCSLATWGQESKIRVSKENLDRRSRLDREFYIEMIHKIIAIDYLFQNLIVSVNNTIYHVGNELRMIERNEGNDLSITSISNDDTLRVFLQLVNSGETNVSNLIKKAHQLGFNKRRVSTYLKDLIRHQILIPDLLKSGPTGYLLDHLINYLALLPKSNNSELLQWRIWLSDLKNILSSMDLAVIGNRENYERLFSIAHRMDFQKPTKNIIQVDSTFKSLGGTINNSLKKGLQMSVEILKLISTTDKKSNKLDRFKRRFLNRYENQEVPLLIALDPESGIDYREGGADFDAFLGALFDESKPAVASENALHSYNIKLLIQKIEDCITEGETVVEISDNDINQMESPNVVFAPSVSVFFRLFGRDQLQIEHIGGSSGINLFSRFSDFDKRLFHIAKKVASIEQKLMDDYIIAEVIHEPTRRSGNVSSFPQLRKYIIPYFSDSMEESAERIPLSDLYLSVRDDRFMIRSANLNKFIIPRISSAVNFRKGSPIYLFLGEIQSQYSSILKFEMPKILPGRAFYPRLSYKNITFSPAMWAVDISEYLAYDREKKTDGLNSFLEKKGIPKLFIVSEGDNELLIERDKELSISAFAEIFRKKRLLLLKEFLFDTVDSIISNEKGDFLNNEMIGILLQPPSNKSLLKHQQFPGQFKNIQRDFSIGSEWLYYKVYCGVVSADKLLGDQILPLVFALRKRKLIGKFFFHKIS